MTENGISGPEVTLQGEGSSWEDILNHRQKFYETLRNFLDKNPASPKLVIGLMAEAAGYAVAQAPDDKRHGFKSYAHDTLDKAVNQQVSG